VGFGWAGLSGLISSFWGIEAVMKTRPPQTEGEQSPTPGSSAFHLICSVGDHFSGKRLASETPCALGPLHCGQLFAVPGLASAACTKGAKQVNHDASTKPG